LTPTIAAANLLKVIKKYPRCYPRRALVGSRWLGLRQGGEERRLSVLAGLLGTRDRCRLIRALVLTAMSMWSHDFPAPRGPASPYDPPICLRVILLQATPWGGGVWGITATSAKPSGQRLEDSLVVLSCGLRQAPMDDSGSASGEPFESVFPRNGSHAGMCAMRRQAVRTDGTTTVGVHLLPYVLLS